MGRDVFGMGKGWVILRVLEIFYSDPGYKDVCFIIKLHIFYMLLYIPHFFSVLKEEDNGCRFPTMVKNNLQTQRAQYT